MICRVVVLNGRRRSICVRLCRVVSDGLSGEGEDEGEDDGEATAGDEDAATLA